MAPQPPRDGSAFARRLSLAVEELSGCQDPWPVQPESEEALVAGEDHVDSGNDRGIEDGLVVGVGNRNARLSGLGELEVDAFEELAEGAQEVRPLPFNDLMELVDHPLRENDLVLLQDQASAWAGIEFGNRSAERTTFADVWTQIWSSNPAERLRTEIRRRTDAVGILPSRDAIIRLVGAVLAEQTDEWAKRRCYLGLDLLARGCANVVPTTEPEFGADRMPALNA